MNFNEVAAQTQKETGLAIDSAEFARHLEILATLPFETASERAVRAPSYTYFQRLLQDTSQNDPKQYEPLAKSIMSVLEEDSVPQRVMKDIKGSIDAKLRTQLYAEVFQIC